MSMDALSKTAPADFIALARARLTLQEPAVPDEGRHGDHALNPDHWSAFDMMANAKPAAVLIPLVRRDSGTQVILTERSAQLRSHSGQIAFPGGRIDDTDTDAIAAALREAQEEIGLRPALVEPIGLLDPYLTGSGYRIIPVVAEVRGEFSLVLNRDEVADAFEAPLDFLMEPTNHQRQSREWKGTLRHFYAMPWNSRYIWGATAGILRNLSHRLAP